MDRIKLSKEEKIVLFALQQKQRKTPLLNDGEFYLAVLSLKQKGLADATINYDKVVAVKLSYFGTAYLQANPTLRNPIDRFRIIEIIFMGVTAIATTVALFISCTLLTK